MHTKHIGKIDTVLSGVLSANLRNPLASADSDIECVHAVSTRIGDAGSISHSLFGVSRAKNGEAFKIKPQLANV